jgi:CO/xanthine dehydrogenase Mo-binding subunit
VQDLRLPGMLHARAVRQPSPGARLLDFDTGPIDLVAIANAVRGAAGVHLRDLPLSAEKVKQAVGV